MPPKKNLMKTQKNENSSKLLEQPFAEEFLEMGLGYGVVSSAVVGQDCSCRERKSILSEKMTARPVIYRGVFGYVMCWGCRLVGKLSGKSAFVGNER